MNSGSELDSNGDGTAKTLSIVAVHVSNDGQFYRGEDNTVTMLSLTHVKMMMNLQSTARTLEVNAHHNKVGGGRKRIVAPANRRLFPKRIPLTTKKHIRCGTNT